MQTTNIAFLLKECESARRSKSWSALERCSLQVLTLAETVNMPEKSLIETIKNYLSSILGSGEFIIKSAEIALKYNPIDGQSFALNALTRAYTERFKRDGEITDIERALELANQSLERKVDIFSANSYIAAAVASGREDEIESANNIREKVNPATSIVDEKALIAAYEAASTIPDEIMQDYLNSRPLPK